MSELVCYIERAERGMLPVRLRLLSTRVDESWSFPEVLADDRAALERGLAEAADWIAGQLKAHSRAGLGALVLDADGARCGWVSAPTADPEAIGQMLSQAAQPISEEDAAHAVGSTPQLALGPDAQMAGATAVQPLGAPKGSAKAGLLGKPTQGAAQARQRFGVMAAPDATIRLLLDELDARSVDISRVVTVWHALAEAFETGGGGGGLDAKGPTTAQVVVDGDTGRLLWSWSRSGSPIAAGAFRLPHGQPTSDGPAGVVLTRSELARLASEWIAWSTQLGASPGRLRVLLPQEVWQDEASLGETVSSIWPGATSDIAFDDDPAAAVLTRFADGLADPRVADPGRDTIVRLQARPGRQHRSMYRWSAVAIALASAVMGVAAFKVHLSAKEAAETAAETRLKWRGVAEGIYPMAVDPQFSPSDVRALQDLRDELDRRRSETAPLSVAPEKPILQELETISLVLGNPDYRLEKIDLGSSAVTIDVVVPDTAAYEELIAAMDSIGGSAVERWQMNARTTPNGVRASMVGLWQATTRAGSGGA